MKATMTDRYIAHSKDETTTKKKEMIIVGSTDVLLGRGKSYRNHPANIQFRGKRALKCYL